MHRGFPYAHFISNMLSRIAYNPQRPTPHFTLFQDQIHTHYRIYKVSAQSVRPLRDAPPVEPRAELGGAATVKEESEDETSSDEESLRHPSPLSHDTEAGGSRDPPPPPAPPPQVTAAYRRSIKPISTTNISCLRASFIKV